MRISPLSYTTQYFVISNYHGIKYKYLIYLDGLKIRINQLSKEETDEPSGLRVEIPLKNYWEGDTWKNAIKRQCQYFDIKNNIIGSWEITENEYVKFSTLTTGKKLQFCLGTVPYPIDFEKLGIPNIVLPFAIKIGLDEGIYCTPNREMLVYTESTKKILLDKIKVFLGHFVDEIEQKLQGLNDWEKLIWLQFYNYDVKYLVPITISKTHLYEIYNLLNRSQHSLLPYQCNHLYIVNIIKGSFNIVHKAGKKNTDYYSENILPKGFKSWFKDWKGNIIRKGSFSQKLIDIEFPLLTDGVMDWLELLRDQYIETLPKVDDLIAKFEASKVKKEKITGYTIVRDSFRTNSLNGWVYEVENQSLKNLEKNYKYIFVVPKDIEVINKWWPIFKSYGKVIVKQKDMSEFDKIKYKMIEIPAKEPSKILRKLVTDALKYKVLKELELPVTDLTVDLIGEVNPHVATILLALDWKNIPYILNDLVESLIETGNLLGCFNERIKGQLEYLQQFEALKYTKYFIIHNDSYGNPWVIKGKQDFLRLWKLELMYRKNLINEYNEHNKQLFSDSESIDNQSQQLDLFEVVD